MNLFLKYGWIAIALFNAFALFIVMGKLKGSNIFFQISASLGWFLAAMLGFFNMIAEI